MKIAICDDDKIIIQEVQKHLTSYFSSSTLEVTYDHFLLGEAVLASGKCFDIAFIDVELPGINGLTLAKKLQQANPKVIIFIITSFQSYLDDAMGLRVFRYLTKPIDKNRLFYNMNFAMEQYHLENQTIMIEGPEGSHLVRTQDILYISIQERSTIIRAKTAGFVSRLTLQEWAERLNPDIFAKPHYSYLVNLQNVHDLFKTEVVLLDGKGKQIRVPVSYRKYAAFKKKFYEFAGGVK